MLPSSLVIQRPSKAWVTGSTPVGSTKKTGTLRLGQPAAPNLPRLLHDLGVFTQSFDVVKALLLHQHLADIVLGFVKGRRFKRAGLF